MRLPPPPAYNGINKPPANAGSGFLPRIFMDKRGSCHAKRIVYRRERHARPGAAR